MSTSTAPKPKPATFAGRLAHLHAELARDKIPVADMRRAETLELQLAGVPDLGRAPHGGGAGEIERLEGPVVARRVPPAPVGSSRLRYFLDGSQRTFLVYRLGVVPAIATVAAAAILVRDEHGNPTISPGTLRLKHAWLVPRRSTEPLVQELVRRIDALGMEIADPLAALADRDEEYAAVAGDYGLMVEHAYVRARKVREELENDLLGDWVHDSARDVDDGWIVVDGRLRMAAPRALGLVKDLTSQHLAGPEAIALFGLPPGFRTTAFRAKDRFRGVGVEAEGSRAATGSNAPCLWYLRLWDASGLDARHALVRVEAAPAVCDSAEIDRLSGWLMAERTPRATADARWATLLYPVHYLEQILKRRVEADTRGWPGAR